MLANTMRGSSSPCVDSLTVCGGEADFCVYVADDRRCGCWGDLVEEQKASMGSATVVMLRQPLVKGHARGFCSNEKTYDVRTFAALQAYFYRCRSELTQTRPMFNLSHTTELPHPNEELSGDVFNPESWRPVLQVLTPDLAAPGSGRRSGEVASLPTYYPP
eukprot:2527085-Rhodomonas_salina.3